MRRDVRIILATVALAGLWTGGSRAARAAAAMDAFRVTRVEVTGLESVERAQVLALLDVAAAPSVWSDPSEWEHRLAAHPLVREARVRRRLPGTLLVHVVERTPVALAAGPTLEPVDGEGVRLPIDPARRRLDLPILETAEAPVPGARLLPSRGRALAAEVARLVEADTAFLQLLSEVSWRDDHTLVARWSEPRVEFLLPPGTPRSRLREGVTVLADALGRDPGAPPTVIDLRYADQVVVRRNR